jgi:hypothetical protein
MYELMSVFTVYFLFVPNGRKKGGEKIRDRDGVRKREENEKYRKRKKKRLEERINSITIARSLVTRRIEGKIEAATAIVYLSSGQVT